MTISVILTTVDDEPGSNARAVAAARLAAQFNAKMRLVATAIVDSPLITTELFTEALIATAEEAARAAADGALTQAKAAIAEALPVKSPEIETGLLIANETAAAEAFAEAALYADLTVLGASGSASSFRTRLIEAALFETPTPLLLWPDARPAPPDRGEEPVVGSAITLAWDGRKESSRAIRAAWPFVERARTVDAVSVRRGFAGEPFDETPGFGLAAWLARRGVSVELRRLDSGGVAERILGDARERGSDLIVMGGYGHSRLREAIFGGVTEDMIRHSDLPLLMAH